MKKVLLTIFIILITTVISADDYVISLIEEFERAGIALRLDPTEVLKADMKIFDGFIKDPQRAYDCGLITASGKIYEKNSIVYLQIRKNSELRQSYLGHLISKRRHKTTTPDDFPESKLLISAEDRSEGIKICEQKKSESSVEQ